MEGEPSRKFKMGLVHGVAITNSIQPGRNDKVGKPAEFPYFPSRYPGLDKPNIMDTSVNSPAAINARGVISTP